MPISSSIALPATHMTTSKAAMEEDRLRVLFLEEECSTPAGFSPSRALKAVPLPQSSGGLASDPTFSPTSSLRSTLGSSSSRRDSLTSSCSDSSQASSVRTTTSSAPSINGAQPWHVLLPDINRPIPETRIRLNYILQCDFAMLNCSATFPAEETGNWIAHSLSHFEALGVCPPPKSVCTFCDEIPKATFEYSDPYAAWRCRLLHIKEEHLAEQDRYEDMRPDYFLLEYMKEKKLLKEEDFVDNMKYTERTGPQRCTCLLRPGEKTKEMIQKDEKSLEEIHDLVKEERLRKKERRGNAGRGIPRPLPQVHQIARPGQ